MSGHHIFGYGSLVNSATHSYGQAQWCELRGWRRQWQHIPERDIAYLSVVPDSRRSIGGVVLDIAPNDTALEIRERAYERSDVSAQVSYAATSVTGVSVFTISAKSCCGPGPESVLLLSYIDVVIQGYYRCMGNAGVQGFFETTTGWGAPVLDDRAAPIYPRHQPLAPVERALCDQWLDSLTIVIKQL